MDVCGRLYLSNNTICLQNHYYLLEEAANAACIWGSVNTSEPIFGLLLIILSYFSMSFALIFFAREEIRWLAKNFL